MARAQQKYKPVPFYLINNEQATKIGEQIAKDFHLKRSKEYPDRWETASGTYYSAGIARRAHRLIQEGL